MPHSPGSCAGFHVCTGHSRSKTSACTLNTARLRLAPARLYPVRTDWTSTHGNDSLQNLAHLSGSCWIPAKNILQCWTSQGPCVHNEVQECTPTS